MAFVIPPQRMVHLISGLLAAALFFMTGYAKARAAVPPGAKGKAEPSCKQWNTATFFEAATVKDVTACLDGGADLRREGRA